MPGLGKCLQSHHIFAISDDVFFLTRGKNFHFLSLGPESDILALRTFLPRVKKKAQLTEILISNGKLHKFRWYWTNFFAETASPD
jgi:hypothetical protein